MDSETEFSDDDIFDYGSERTNSTPFPAECHNEIEGIESFYQCFIDRYSACPAFFMGSLQEACQSAYSSSVVKEHRPILVYIHHDKSLLSNIFCSTIFCSEIVIDYLLENYIVWPWDITDESNRNTLMRIWTELFSSEISFDQCPMLIGIMRSADMKKSWSIKSRYQFTLLLENDQLTRTQMKLTRERLLNELMTFKEQCDQNEQLLLFDFATTTRLPWDMILEIANYLTLDDAVVAFSPKILSLLGKYKTKLHLSTTSKPFIDMILQRINPEQIVSLQFDVSRFWSKVELSSLEIFPHITSLILLNIELKDQIHHYEESFPNLISLSLYYDNEMNFLHLSRLINELRSPIKRLEIHCVASFCSHDVYQLGNSTFLPKRTIAYFLFDIRHFPLITTNRCSINYRSCLLMQLIDLIQIMTNIRYICFIINKYNMEKLLDVYEWQKLFDESYQLKKVTLKVMGNVVQNERLRQKILAIQNLRQTTKFEILFL